MSMRHGPLGLLLIAALPALAWAQPVGSEFQVNTQTIGKQYAASVASDASGNFVVVWYGDTDGYLFGVFGQRYDSAGDPVGSEFQVNTYTFSNTGGPVVATEPGGAFVVAWGSNDQEALGNPGVFGQRYDSAGNAVGPEFHVNTHTTNIQAGAAIAVNPSGHFVVVWHSLGQDGSSYGVFGQRYDASGSPQAGEFQVNTYTTAQQANAAVAWLANGDFVVVWHSDGQDGSSFGVFGQRYDSSGSPLGGEFQVNTATVGFQFYPDVAADANGNFVVVWGGEDGSYNGIFGQRFDSAGNPLGGEFQINTYTTGGQGSSSVACDDSGNFAVVWTDGSGQDGSARGVFGRRFDASGNPLGGEFQVNTHTTGVQGARTAESVSSDPVGNLVVVWTDVSGQDGSSYGVFGQRFASPTRTLVDTSQAQLWVGLKNSDDQGTRFDVRTALYVNDTLVTEGTTRCVTGITRNPAQAKDVPVLFGPISNGEMTSGDSFSLKVFTRIGTNPNGSKCPGHSNAVGLRLYYDAVSRPSRFGAEITPDPLTDYFLHSSGSTFFLDTASPTSTQAKQKDSGPVNFAGGNPWREIGTWSRVVP